MEEKNVEIQSETLKISDALQDVEKEAEELKKRETVKAEEESYKENVDRKKSKYVVSVVRDEKVLKMFVKFSNTVKHPRTTGYMAIVGGSMFILPFINNEIALPGVIICHIVGALMVLMGLFRHRIGVYLLKSNPETKMGEEFTYLFGNTGVKLEKNGKIEHIGSYKKIYRIWEEEKIFYIGMNEDDLLVLPKTNFEVGDVSTFRDFIVEKSRCIYTWKPTRIDNVIRQNIMNFKIRMTQMRMDMNDKEEKQFIKSYEKRAFGFQMLFYVLCLFKISRINVKLQNLS